MRKLLFALSIVFSVLPAHARFRLPEGQACADLPFRLIDNRAVFEATVEGRGPYQFIFDTGANSILDAALARELGVSLDDIGQTGGAGAATQSTWRTRLKSVSFGGIAGVNEDFMALDLSQIQKAIGFERLDGLLGREVLAAFLVRYDFDASRLRICDPVRAPKDVRAGTAFKFRIGEFNMPVVSAVLDGRAGDYIVDTGDRSSLTLFGPFVAKNKLREGYPRRVSTITGQGVGGPIPADVVRAKTFAFSQYLIPAVTTRMPTLSAGAFASEGYAGSIGNGVMRRFNVTFDYRARTMYLQPNSYFEKPDRYDRSGMWLTGGMTDGIKVSFVTENGPAAKGGIVAGDAILAVNGVAVTEKHVIELRDRLMDSSPGTKIRLELRSPTGARRVVTVVLADQI